MKSAKIYCRSLADIVGVFALSGWTAIALGVCNLLPISAAGQNRELYAQELERYVAEHAQLMQEREALRQQYREATPTVRERAKAAWKTQNNVRLQALQLLARDVARLTPRSLLPIVSEVHVPSDATPELEELLTSAADLQNELAAIKNALIDASAEERQQAVRSWRLQNATQIEAVLNLAKTVAAQADARPRIVPLAPFLPTALSPAWRTFHVEHYELAREQALLKNVLLELLPDDRDRRVQRWQIDSLPRRIALLTLTWQLAEEQEQQRLTR